MKGKIRVYCRLRPLNDKEAAEKERSVLKSVDEFTVEHIWRDDKIKQHCYDRVFDGNASQIDVFEDTKACVVTLLICVNCCVVTTIFTCAVIYPDNSNWDIIYL